MFQNRYPGSAGKGLQTELLSIRLRIWRKGFKTPNQNRSGLRWRMMERGLKQSHWKGRAISCFFSGVSGMKTQAKTPSSWRRIAKIPSGIADSVGVVGDRYSAQHKTVTSVSKMCFALLRCIIIAFMSYLILKVPLCCAFNDQQLHFQSTWGVQTKWWGLLLVPTRHRTQHSYVLSAGVAKILLSLSKKLCQFYQGWHFYSLFSRLFIMQF